MASDVLPVLTHLKAHRTARRITSTWERPDGNARNAAVAEVLLILVVEDHAYTREVIVRLLELLGYDAEGAEDGCTAIARMHECTPQLVILDRMMPDMDGIEVLRQIRKDRGFNRVPVIFYSALEFDVSEIGTMGVQEYVQKGTRWETLLDCVQKYVTPKRAPADGLTT